AGACVDGPDHVPPRQHEVRTADGSRAGIEPGAVPNHQVVPAFHPDAAAIENGGVRFDAVAGDRDPNAGVGVLRGVVADHHAIAGNADAGCTIPAHGAVCNGASVVHDDSVEPV